MSTHILQMNNSVGGNIDEIFKRVDSYDNNEQYESKTDAALIHPQM